MNPQLVEAIDQIRSSASATPQMVERELKRQGVENPRDAISQYMQTPLPDGRLRGQVNPGDPAEWGVR